MWDAHSPSDFTFTILRQCPKFSSQLDQQEWLAVNEKAEISRAISLGLSLNILSGSLVSTPLSRSLGKTRAIEQSRLHDKSVAASRKEIRQKILDAKKIRNSLELKVSHHTASVLEIRQSLGKLSLLSSVFSSESLKRRVAALSRINVIELELSSMKANLQLSGRKLSELESELKNMRSSKQVKSYINRLIHQR